MHRAALLVAAAVLTSTIACPQASTRSGKSEGGVLRVHDAPTTSTGLSQNPVTQRLVLLHMSDGESAIVPKDGAGGFARAVSVVEALRRRSAVPTLLLLAGDTIIPAPEVLLQLRDKNAVAAAYEMFGAQGSALGNHEFDLGEEFLAEYVKGSAFPYLSATVDVRGGPLDAIDVEELELANGTPWLERTVGRITPRGKTCAGKLRETPAGLVCDGLTVGVVGATTETLRLVSKISDNIRLPDDVDGVRNAIQTQVEALRKDGIDVIVLLSHMQDVNRELILIERGLVGVDVIVAGGGDDRLADATDRLLEGDARAALCASERSCFPLVRRAADGHPVLVVSTGGNFGYVGELGLSFDRAGDLVSHDATSRPWPVDGKTIADLGAAPNDAALAFEREVDEQLRPLALPFGKTKRWLEGGRDEVRNRETNLGDLSADAIVWAAREANGKAAAFALRNGGGIRAAIGTVDRTSFAKSGGPLRPIDLKTSFRFDTPLVVVTTTHRVLRETIESALRGAGTGRGHFPQASREVYLEYTRQAPEQTHVAKDGRIVDIVCPGARVRTLAITSEAGTVVPIVVDGALVTPNETITWATLEYLAKGGDSWFPSGAPKWSALKEGGKPVTEQSALHDFVVAGEKTGAWQDGEAYVDPAPGQPTTFPRIREVRDAPTSLPKGCAPPPERR